MKIECDGKVIGISTDEKKTVVKMEIYGAEEVIRDLYDIRSEHVGILIGKDEEDNQVTLGEFEEVTKYVCDKCGVTSEGNPVPPWVIGNDGSVLCSQCFISPKEDEDEVPRISIPLIVDETGKPLQDDDPPESEAIPEDPVCCRCGVTSEGNPVLPWITSKNGRMFCARCYDQAMNPGMIFCDGCNKLTEEIDLRECEMMDGEKKLLCPSCLLGEKE